MICGLTWFQTVAEVVKGEERWMRLLGRGGDTDSCPRHLYKLYGPPEYVRRWRMVAAYCEATATTLSPKQTTKTLSPKYVAATCQETHCGGRQATAHVPI